MPSVKALAHARASVLIADSNVVCRSEEGGAAMGARANAAGRCGTGPPQRTQPRSSYGRSLYASSTMTSPPLGW